MRMRNLKLSFNISISISITVFLWIELHCDAFAPARVTITFPATTANNICTALGGFNEPRSAIKNKPHAYRNTEDITKLSDTTDIDRKEQAQPEILSPLNQKRDRAILALYTNLDMPIEAATKLIDNYPQLYQDIPSLATRLLYLLGELYIPKKKLLRMFDVHPTMMLNVILDDPENTLISTAQLLQNELHLTLQQITQPAPAQLQQLITMDRLHLKAKLHHLKQFFPLPQLQHLVLHHSDLLTSTTKNKATTTTKKAKLTKTQITALEDALLSDEMEDFTLTLSTTDPLLLKRDRTIMALQQILGMDLTMAIQWLDDFPQLYTDISSLTTRLLFLSAELNLTPTKIRNLIERHPRMMVRVLLDDPEVTLQSTVQVLQQELQLSTIGGTANNKVLWQLDRTDLKPKLTFLQQYLTAPTLRSILLKYPAFLTTSLDSMKTCISLLQQELHVSDSHVGIMLKRFPRLLQVNRLSERLQIWTTGPLGQGLREIDRRGVRAAEAPTPQEANRIQHLRAMEILFKDPEILANDIVPINCHYLLHSCGCTIEQLGKIAYRRPDVLTYSNQIMTAKIQQISTELDLPIQRNSSQDNAAAAIDILARYPDLMTLSIKDNLQPKFDFFRNDVGLSTSEMRDIFTARPHILTLKLQENLQEKISYFRTVVGMDPESLRALLHTMPDCLRQNFITRIVPRCEVVLKYGLTLPNDVPSNYFRASEETYEKWLMFLKDGGTTLKHQSGRSRRSKGVAIQQEQSETD